MKKIGFSGTLDPITNGHMWVMGEARSLADEVVVFLSENPVKQPRFSAEERKRIVEQSALDRGWHNVQVVIVKADYTARAAKKHGADYLIRGIRTTADFDYENLIQQTNVDVLHGAKTIFVMPPRDLGSVSSSFIKSLEGPVGWNWTMKKFVPGAAYHAWIMGWLRKDWDALWSDGAGEGDGAVQPALAEHWFAHLTGAASYGGPRRHYHNLDHLVHGLSEIRAWAANTRAPARDMCTLKKAFWFHDALHQHDDCDLFSPEEASARLWLSSGLADAVGDAVGDEVAALIRATDHFHGGAVEHRLKDAMLSVDLTILGQDEDIYQAYRQAIRREYGHVPDAEFGAQRRQMLIHLRDQAQAGRLYGDRFFAAQYHDQAIDNLTREIDALGGC
jgi:pantetheine-phosphate adenylyltransferase